MVPPASNLQSRMSKEVSKHEARRKNLRFGLSGFGFLSSFVLRIFLSRSLARSPQGPGREWFPQHRTSNHECRKKSQSTKHEGRTFVSGFQASDFFRHSCFGFFCP